MLIQLLWEIGELRFSGNPATAVYRVQRVNRPAPLFPGRDGAALEVTAEPARRGSQHRRHFEDNARVVALALACPIPASGQLPKPMPI